MQSFLTKNLPNSLSALRRISPLSCMPLRAYGYPSSNICANKPFVFGTIKHYSSNPPPRQTGNEVPLPNPTSSQANQGAFSQGNRLIWGLLVLLGGAAFLGKKFVDSRKSGTPGGPSGSEGRSAGGSYVPLFHMPSFTPSPQHIDLPESVQYLIIGAGTAAFAAYRAIRAADAEAKVLIVGEELHAPYQRPPLSKELWYSDDREVLKRLRFKMWNGRERSLYYEKDGFYCSPTELNDTKHGGVAHALGVKIDRLDVDGKKAVVSDGRTISYDKCLIATGGKPKSLPVFDKAGKEVKSRTTLFRNVDDFKRLYDTTGTIKSVAVVGGGFLGSELACALGKRGLETGVKVTQVFPEPGNMGLVLPEYLSKFATEKVRKEGVDVIPDVTVKDCSYDSWKKQIILELSNGNKVTVDHLVVAVGLEPNTELAERSSLELDDKHGGFRVNAELEARSNVWAAGKQKTEKPSRDSPANGGDEDYGKGSSSTLETRPLSAWSCGMCSVKCPSRAS